ncbi:MAG: metal ABC transporter substrate-binding protein [Campylobacterota bacterium]|nr:metal ABC transporter substrate-binding protein [Campylobacterota bacterium]
MKKAIIFLLLIVIVLVGFLTFKSKEGVSTQVDEKPRIAVSTFAMYDIVKHIVDERVELFMVVPFGTDLHSFEPTPKDLVRLSKSKLFIYSGAGLEPWSDAFAESTETLNISKFVKLRHLEDEDEMAHPEEEAQHADDTEHDEHEEEHHHEGVDPHYWLDSANMIRATEVIKERLSQLIPEGAEEFQRNSEKYIAQLHKLDNRYKRELSSCKQSMIVVNHNAFGYLAERYGFKVTALTGLSPESMPSAKRMAQLSDLVKSHHLKTVFFESFVSDRLIKEIANETGAKVQTLQPLGNITADEAEQNMNYIELMERNLDKLKAAMECA